MTTVPRDRLRDLLDAVLDENNGSVADMAGDAFTSPFHFGRLVARAAGESPMAMRRRVMLERAAWQLRQGVPVTDAAWTAGYTSVEGFSRAFSRAFGHPRAVRRAGDGCRRRTASTSIHPPRCGSRRRSSR